MKVLFLGAGPFSALSLKSFLKHSSGHIKSIDILTNQPGSELEIMATSSDCTLPIKPRIFHCPPKSLNFSFNWNDFSIGIVSSFSLFIPARVIDQIPLINIHPSVLPQWRGPAPIQYALLAGHETTGVSIIDLHPKVIDAGSVLLQESFPIPNHGSIWYKDLEAQLADLGGKLASQVTLNFEHFNTIKQPQNDKSAVLSNSRKISKLDGIISFKTDSFDRISRKVRALSHQIPIKSLDLLPDRQVILEDIILDQSIFNSKSYNFSSNRTVYDKSIGAVVFDLGTNCVGVCKFKIEGKSQIFTAGSFYSNYLKNK